MSTVVDEQQAGEQPVPLSEAKGSSSAFRAPPPWKVKAHAWWMILSVVGRQSEWAGGTDADGNRYRINGISPSHFDPLEEESRRLGTSLGAFRGGLGTVQLLRYFDTPIGPYDELLISPGAFEGPKEPSRLGTSELRITRIYVSTLQSVFNGRANWNIPKHLARFEFQTLDKSTNDFQVKIYPMESFSFTPNSSQGGWDFEPQFSSTPFFSAVIRHHFPRLLLPINLSKIPMLNIGLLQPPIKKAPNFMTPEEQLPNPNWALVGNSTWKYVTPLMKGKIGLCSFKGTLCSSRDQFGDGEHFPDIEPYSYGFFWDPFEAEFPDATNL